LTDDCASGADDVAGALYAGEGLRKLRFLMTDNTEERLPGYAPDLNPVETLWGNIKGQELATRCADNLAEVETAVREGMERVGTSNQLAF